MPTTDTAARAQMARRKAQALLRARQERTKLGALQAARRSALQKAARLRVKPLPEVVDPAPGGRRYMVKHTYRHGLRTGTDAQGPVGLFAAPMGQDAFDLSLRNHELAHARWTPPGVDYAQEAKEHGVEDPQLLEACEDYRVNRLAAKAGVPVPFLTLPVLAEPTVQTYIKGRDLSGLVKHAFARWACSAFSGGGGFSTPCVTDADGAPITEPHILCTALEEQPIHNLVMHIISLGQEAAYAGDRALECADFDRSIAAALAMQKGLSAADREMRELCGMPMPGEGEGEGESQPGKGKAQAQTWGGTVGAEAWDRILENKDVLEAFMQLMQGLSQGTANWGRMGIIQHKFKAQARPQYRGLRWACAQEGLIPSRVHRLPIDGQIFAAKLKRRDAGGTVLVDCSGSMGIRQETLERFTASFPMATVALYSGSGPRGVLHIIAKGGKRIARGDMPSMPGMNVIDGPALRWLAKQERPRFWVCDGGTSGKHDSPGGYPECKALCRLHDIEQVHSFSRFLQNMGLAPGRGEDEE